MGTEARSEELNTSDALRVLSETAGDQTRMSVFVCVLRKQDSSFESLKRQHILHPSQHQHSLPQLCSFRTLKSLLSQQRPEHSVHQFHQRRKININSFRGTKCLLMDALLLLYCSSQVDSGCKSFLHPLFYVHCPKLKFTTDVFNVFILWSNLGDNACGFPYCLLTLTKYQFKHNTTPTHFLVYLP